MTSEKLHSPPQGSEEQKHNPDNILASENKQHQPSELAIATINRLAGDLAVYKSGIRRLNALMLRYRNYESGDYKYSEDEAKLRQELGISENNLDIEKEVAVQELARQRALQRIVSDFSKQEPETTKILEAATALFNTTVDALVKYLAIRVKEKNQKQTADEEMLKDVAIGFLSEIKTLGRFKNIASEAEKYIATKKHGNWLSRDKELEDLPDQVLINLGIAPRTDSPLNRAQR